MLDIDSRIKLTCACCGALYIPEECRTSEGTYRCPMCNRFPLKWGYCWNCGVHFPYENVHRIGYQTYGHICTGCGESMYKHPVHGKGKDYDYGSLTLKKKFYYLVKNNPQGAIDVYVAHGCKPKDHWIVEVTKLKARSDEITQMIAQAGG